MKRAISLLSVVLSFAVALPLLADEAWLLDIPVRGNSQQETGEVRQRPVNDAHGVAGDDLVSRRVRADGRGLAERDRRTAVDHDVLSVRRRAEAEDDADFPALLLGVTAHRDVEEPRFIREERERDCEGQHDR